ncbi:MAG: hypothetical protein CVU11_06440 [Bacteroidetes bacterium HGW-Bacteroidetes-6]|jgi:hypothetical protein|nr:MAG: hypothetical protein CVU11_06440 [Bacteroidetes bacterium HGW-Bacteroidetes-6]
MKLQQITYKNRYRLLLAGIVVLAVIVYHFGFSKTIAMYQLKNELIDRSSEVEDAPQRISGLKQQVAAFESLISGNPSDTTETRNKIMNYVSRFCNDHNLTLSGFLPPVDVDRGTFILETNILEIEGDFSTILRLVYNMEMVWKPGKVVSVKFFTSEDLRTKTLKLFAHVYIQKVKTKI